MSRVQGWVAARLYWRPLRAGMSLQTAVLERHCPPRCPVRLWIAGLWITALCLSFHLVRGAQLFAEDAAPVRPIPIHVAPVGRAPNTPGNELEIAVNRLPTGELEVSVVDRRQSPAVSRVFRAADASELRRTSPQGYEFFKRHLRDQIRTVPADATQPENAVGTSPIASTGIWQEVEIRRADRAVLIRFQPHGPISIVVKYADPESGVGWSVVADNFDALAQQKPEAAELFQKFIDPQIGRVRPKAGRTLNMAEAEPLIRLVAGEQPPARMGEPRKREIRIDDNLRRIELRDDFGRDIELQIADLTAVPPSVVRHHFATLHELRNRNPELGQLYDRLTGASASAGSPAIAVAITAELPSDGFESAPAPAPPEGPLPPVAQKTIAEKLADLQKLKATLEKSVDVLDRLARNGKVPAETVHHMNQRLTDTRDAIAELERKLTP